jgi:hypothetical protein
MTAGMSAFGRKQPVTWDMNERLRSMRAVTPRYRGNIFENSLEVVHIAASRRRITGRFRCKLTFNA